MTDQITNPTIDDIRRALNSSGYLLEQRICHPIASKGYTLFPNDQYEDDETGKSREIDLVAEKRCWVETEKVSVLLETHLVIEAKTNPYPVILFLNKKGFYDPAIPCVSYPRSLNFKSKRINRRFSVGGKGPYDFFLGMHGFNEHFMKYRPAFQYGLLKPEKPRSKTECHWAIRHDDLYDSFTGIVKAMHYHKGSCNASAKQSCRFSKKECITCVFIYPLVLFSGDVFTCELGRDGALRIEKARNVFLYKRHSSRTISDVIPVFVITENELTSFLNKVEKNLRKAIEITDTVYLNGKGVLREERDFGAHLDDIFGEPDTTAIEASNKRTTKKKKGLNKSVHTDAE